jgi:hypothetical protein
MEDPIICMPPLPPTHLKKKKARHGGLNVKGMLIVSYYTDGVVHDAHVP